MTNDFTPKYMPLDHVPELIKLMDDRREDLQHAGVRYEAVMRIAEIMIERHPGEYPSGRAGIFSDIYDLLGWVERVTARLQGASHAE